MHVICIWLTRLHLIIKKKTKSMCLYKALIPLIKDLGWESIEDLIQYELQMIVYKFSNGLAPRYPYNVLVADSSDSSYSLRNTATDSKLPKKTSFNGKMVYPTMAQKCGTAN